MSLRFKRAMKNFNGKKANFTIDHILNVAGEKHTKESLKSTSEVAKEEKFEWLTCTRYSPPKLPSKST